MIDLPYPYPVSKVTDAYNRQPPVYLYEIRDGNNTGWIDPYQSGEVVNVSHTWNKKGFYTIKAKARNVHGVEGDWCTLSIIAPIYKITTNILFMKLLERFPNAFTILRHSIMGL
jgi:hypothetical protein